MQRKSGGGFDNEVKRARAAAGPRVCTPEGEWVSKKMIFCGTSRRRWRHISHTLEHGFGAQSPSDEANCDRLKDQNFRSFGIAPAVPQKFLKPRTSGVLVEAGPDGAALIGGPVLLFKPEIRLWSSRSGATSRLHLAIYSTTRCTTSAPRVSCIAICSAILRRLIDSKAGFRVGVSKKNDEERWSGVAPGTEAVC